MHSAFNRVLQVDVVGSGHSPSFQGPGKHLHRFKNAEARDAYEAWYARKLREGQQHKPQPEKLSEVSVRLHADRGFTTLSVGA